MKMILERSNSAEAFFTVGWRYWITPSFDLGVVIWIVDQLFFNKKNFFFKLFFYLFSVLLIYLQLLGGRGEERRQGLFFPFLVFIFLMSCVVCG